MPTNTSPRPALRRLFPLAILTSALGAQSWQLAAPAASPPGRAAGAMATDLGAGRTVLFGGALGATYLGDTWEYDGGTWNAIAGTAPGGRARHAMAFDEARGRVVLFGGMNGTGFNNYLGDTWEYGNGTWQQRSSAPFPPVRFGHAMAYDRTRARVVMFGGRTRSGQIFMSDTWEYDGTAWLPFTPAAAPTPRMGHAMAFDAQNGQVLLFGGIQLGGPIVGDTWTWNGATWTQRLPAHSPSPRMDAACATDLRGRIVIYAGYDGGDLTDTAEWNGSDWTVLATPVQPGVPVLPAMATGPAGGHVVLFGGEDSGGAAHAATWWFDAFAAAAAYGTGCGAPPLALGAVAGGTPVLGQAFQSAMTGVPAGAGAFQSLGFSNTTWLGIALPLDLAQFAMPGCWLLHDAAALFLPCTLAGGTATHSFAVPALPSIAGWTVYLQGYALAPGSNPAGILTSNGLALTFGY
ncbi:MAG: kelch repeat-containing protein [Planctomycetota bacterium]